VSVLSLCDCVYVHTVDIMPQAQVGLWSSRGASKGLKCWPKPVSAELQ